MNKLPLVLAACWFACAVIGALIGETGFSMMCLLAGFGNFAFYKFWNQGS